MNKFKFVVSNVRRSGIPMTLRITEGFREKSGQKRILKKTERLKKWLSWMYPPWKKEPGDGIYDAIFQDGTRANSMLLLFRNIFMIEMFGMIMYLLLSFKYSQYPEL